MKRAVILLALLALAAADAAPKNPFEQGIKLYEQGRYADAVREFSRAEQIDPKDILAKYNGLTSLAAAGDLQRALAKLGADFEALDVRPSVRARAAYNLGTAFLGLADEADRAGQLQTRAGELTESAKWLRRSLLDSPGDNQVRNNLEYANKLLDKLRQQQQKQQKQQQNGEGKDQKDQQQQQNQSDQNRQQQNEQQQQQNKQQEGQQQNEQQQRERQGTQQEQQQQRKPREIPPDVARNLLKAARDAELKALKMLRDQQNKDAKKQPGNRKDW